MKDFLNKPITDVLVFKAIAKHHFRMPPDHLELFMQAFQLEKENC